MTSSERHGTAGVLCVCVHKVYSVWPLATLWQSFEFPLRLSTMSTGWVHQSVPSSRGCARVAPVHRRRLQCPPSMGLHPLLAREFTLSRFVCCQMDGSALLYHPASAPASSCLAPRRRLVARRLCFNSGVVIRSYAPQVCNAACNRAPASPANAHVLDPCLARRFSAYCHHKVSGVRKGRSVAITDSQEGISGGCR